jgi:uncharacterized protein (DUF4415 family)
MTKLTRAQAREIRTLQRMRDEEIDFTDIPLTVDWSKAVVGKFYRPIKTSLTIRLDADVLAWLKGQGAGYQTRINALLRNAMESSGSAAASRAAHLAKRLQSRPVKTA